jgi:hypothetical protein
MGRPRSSKPKEASTSDRKTKWLKETDVLKRIPEKLRFADEEWTEFELYDAVVYEKDGKTMANALEVESRGPFIIRGRLEIMEMDQEKRCI